MITAWGMFTVDLELTNRCGESCLFCPRQALTRPAGMMPAGLVEKIAAALGETTSQVTFSGMGDPLAHPELEGCVAAFRQQGIATGVQVSAAALSAQRIERLSAAAPSFVNLSLPSGEPGVLARLVPERDPEDLLANVKQLSAALRGRIPLTLIGTRTALEAEEGDSLGSVARANGLPWRVFPCHSRGGNLMRSDLLATPGRPGLSTPCGLFARHGFVTWQGDLLACCHDLTGETRLGNLGDDPVSDLLARKTARAGQIPPFPLCAACDEPLRSLPLPDRPPPVTNKGRRAYLRSLGLKHRAT